MIHFVIGTRAQLFKMAPIMRECDKRGFQWRWIYTAQHKETIDKTLQTFGLPEPNYTVVNWDTEAKTIGKMAYWLFSVITSLFKGRKILGGHIGKRSIVLTHGDTITTWWGALLGRMFFCKVMHVEAGLRSHNLFNPFPEEINRIITGVLSNYHICPGQAALDNLKGYPGKKILTKYNTQADTITLGIQHSDDADIVIPDVDYAVVSIHRYENIFKKNQFEIIISQLEDISTKIKLLFVLHPATKTQIEKLGFQQRLDDNTQIELISRQEYLPFIKLIKNSQYVITDGGGNQEELYFLGKPTLLFRNETERPEELGVTAVLSKFDKEIIDEFVHHYDKYAHDEVPVDESPSEIIADVLVKYSTHVRN